VRVSPFGDLPRLTAPVAVPVPKPMLLRLPHARVPLPPAHRVLFAFAILLLLVMLLVQGFSAHRIGKSGTGSGATPSVLHGSGALLALRDGRLSAIGGAPGRRVALTFDDGPSRWTTRIASILRRNRVPATFFVIGSQAVRYPGVLRQLAAEGFLIGNHTYTHVDLSTVSAARAKIEVGLTQNVIAGITGREPRLFRPPYSSSPGAVSPAQLAGLRTLARQGFVVTLSNFNTEDWSRPGVAAIVRNATPTNGSGGIVMLHDGGGDRSQTLAAVRRLIPLLRHRGFRFVSLATLSGLPTASLDVPVVGTSRLRAELVFWALAAAAFFARALTVVVLAIGVLTAVRMLAVLWLTRRRNRRPQPFDPAFAPPVSVIVPAYNEEVTIARTVTSLVESAYQELEVIVVDDGSTDGTGAAVERLGLSRVTLLRQRNAGKAAALNRGLAAARHDLIVMVDADTVFEPQALSKLVQPFADPSVGGVSGNTKVGNRDRLLGRWQHIEYVMGFNLDRRVYDLLRCMPTVPGAIGAFRREALAATRGVPGATLAEDTDLTIAVGRAGWHVAYAPEARAWTEVPSTLGALWRQRLRWSYGTLQSVWKHRGAVRRGDAGAAGRRAIPYLVLFQILLPLAAPLIDLFGIFGILFLHPLPIIAFWLAFNGMQMLLAVYAFRLDGESLRPLWALPVQQFVYRQLMYLVVFESVVSALRGVRLDWNHLPRTGEASVRA
jgi:cellulose synthase/poly-beta-1,6-N-acetylglucosamine synthase-like glycosyltransferase/peptidoglycan/xylan/chitin deacetylase (PgdA/CDA1 family)